MDKNTKTEFSDTMNDKRTDSASEKYDDNINTAYDDAFHTMLLYCKSLVIPVLNEGFQQIFSGSEEVVPGENRIYIRRQGGKEEKRITDASFAVVSASNVKSRFHVECQSRPDNSMLVRMFEYDSQIALQNGILIEDTLEVEFPNSAVLNLSSKGKKRKKLKIVIKTPGGAVSYEIPVLNVQDYDLDTIFEKGLYFLLPFYIFRYEDEFDSISNNPDKVEELKSVYVDIEKCLDKVVDEGKIDEYTKICIMEMALHVLRKIAEKYTNIIEEVSKVMGGNVIRFKARIVYEEGMKEGMINTIINLVRKGRITIEDAAEELGISKEEFSKKMAG